MTAIQSLAKNIRISALQMVCRAKAAHIGGALSCADILAVLYSSILNVDPKQPDSDYPRFFYYE